MKERTRKFLLWSQKYTKTDMIYLAKGGFWLSLGQIFVSLSAFILSIVYANFLSKETFGTYKYVLAASGVISSLTLTGLGTALVKSTARTGGNMLRAAFFVHMKWSFFIFLLGLIGFIYYVLNENLLLAYSFLIIGTLSPISQSSGLYLSFLNGRANFRLKSIFDVLNNFIPLVALITTILLTDNVLLLVFVYFISYTATTLFFYHRTLRQYPESSELDAGTLQFGKHLSLMNILGSVAAQADKLLIFHFLGAAELAIYALALAPATQLGALLKTLNILSLPKFSEQNISNIKQFLPRKLLKLSLAISIPVLLYIYFAPTIFSFLYPKYLASVPISQIYILILLLYPQEIMRTVLTAHESKASLYFLTTIGPIIKIILLAILLPLYGIWGGVGALLLNSTINTMISYFFLLRMR